MNKIKQITDWLNEADAVIITAGNLFSKMEGLDLLDEASFRKDFPDIAKKYKADTIADALDKNFDSASEQWDFWSKLIYKYSENYQPSEAMQALVELLKGKNYFIATSSFGHFFEKAGFDKERIFNAFGDWTQIQCSSGLNHGVRSDLKVVQDYLEGKGKVPKCEDCNSDMELHIPLNAHFFPNEDENTRFRWFLTKNQDKKVLVLELGVDPTSPQLLDPMVSLAQSHPTWHYVAADLAQDDLPDEMQKSSLGMNMPTEKLLLEMRNEG